MAEPITIKDEHMFWMLIEELNGEAPSLTQGALAQMIGVDLLTLRHMYAEYCEREGSAVAGRQRAVIARFPPEVQERMKRGEFAHLYEARNEA